jgi:hypothetical protein
MKQFGKVALFTASNWTPKQESLPGVDIWKHSNVEKQRLVLENLNHCLWWLYPNKRPDAD